MSKIKNKIGILIFLSVFIMEPTPSNAQSADLVPAAMWLAYLALNSNIPFAVQLPDIRQDGMVETSNYMDDKRLAFNFCVTKLRSEILRLQPSSSTNYIHSFKTDIFFAQIMKNNRKPQVSDFLVLFSSPTLKSQVYDIGDKISTPKYGYKTYFYVGSKMTNARFTIQQDLAADTWGINLDPDTYSLDFVTENATRNILLKLDPYFEGILETLTISGN